MLVQRVCKFWQYGLGRTVVATLAAHSNSISVGMCQGYSAILVPQLQQNKAQDPDTPLKVSEEDASWIAALGVISTPLGALLAGILLEIWGRKFVVQLTNAPLLVGWICIALSSSVLTLCIGRFITGIGQGMGTSAAYVYVAEVATAEHRGTLSACGPILVSIGVLVVYTLGMVSSWSTVAAFCAVFVVLSFVVVAMIPESPPWLATQGRSQDALKSLIWLRRSTAVADRELAELVAAVDKDKEEEPKQSGSLARYVTFCKTPQVWKPFLILLAFFMFQEGSGIYVLLFYAVSLFQDVGTEMNEYLASIWLACMRLFMAGLGALAIQRINRRSLATFSGAGMAISMAIAGLYCHLFWKTEPGFRPYTWIPLICFLAHVCVSMLGYLQLPWIMCGELFPLRVRGVMGGMVTSLAHVLIFVSVKTYPNLREAMGMDGLLWAYAVVAGGGALFGYFLLPETRGRTLREIEASFVGSGGSDSGRRENGAQLEAGFPPTKEPTVFTINLSGDDLKGRLR